MDPRDHVGDTPPPSSSHRHRALLSGSSDDLANSFKAVGPGNHTPASTTTTPATRMLILPDPDPTNECLVSQGRGSLSEKSPSSTTHQGVQFAATVDVVAETRRARKHKPLPAGLVSASSQPVVRSEWKMPEPPMDRFLNALKWPMTVGFLPEDDGEIRAWKRLSCKLVFAMFIAVIVLDAGAIVIHFTNSNMVAFTSLIPLLSVSLLLQIAGYFTYAWKKSPFIMDLTTIAFGCLLIPLALFGSALAAFAKSNNCVEWLSYGHSFMELTPWLAVIPMLLVCLGYSTFVHRGGFVLSVAIFIIANVINMVLENKQGADSADLLWTWDIFLIIFKGLPIVFSYLAILSQCHILRCGQAVLEVQIDECQCIADGITRMDFDFLDMAQDTMAQEHPHSSPLLLKLLFEIGEGLREYRAYLPTTLFPRVESRNCSEVEYYTVPTSVPRPSTSLHCQSVGSVNEGMSGPPPMQQSIRRNTRSGSSVGSPVGKGGRSDSLWKPASLTGANNPLVHTVSGKGFGLPTALKRSSIARQSISAACFGRSGLSVRSISLAVFRLKGLCDLVQLDVPLIQSLNEGFIDLIHRYVDQHRGIIHSFDSGLVVVHWNTHQQVVAHARQCCSAIEKIEEEMKARTIRWSAEHGVTVKLQVGVATGPAVCGHTGTTDTRRYNVFGAIWPLCHILSKMNEDLGTTVLVSNMVMNDAQYHYRFRPACVLSSVEGTNITVFEMMETLDTFKSDEWMYEMQCSERANPYAEYEQGFAKMQNGHWDDAVKHFQLYIRGRTAEDPLATKYLQWCRQKTLGLPFVQTWKECLQYGAFGEL